MKSLSRARVLFFFAAFMFCCFRSMAENAPKLSSGFDLDLSRNPSDAEQVRIYGGMPKQRAPAAPLIEAFEQCHFEAVLGLAKGLTGGARAYARTVNGDSRPLLLSGNFAGGMHNGRWVEVAAIIEFLISEGSKSFL